MQETSSYCLVGVTDSIAVGLLHIHAELVLLVTAHVCVTHEVQRVVMNAHRGCNKVQLHLQRGAVNDKMRPLLV